MITKEINKYFAALSGSARPRSCRKPGTKFKTNGISVIQKIKIKPKKKKI